MQNPWKILEGVATLLYGHLALILLFTAGMAWGASTSVKLTIATAALTYVFQALTLVADEDESTDVDRWSYILMALQLFIVALYVLAFLFLLIGGTPHVLV